MRSPTLQSKAMNTLLTAKLKKSVNPAKDCAFDKAFVIPASCKKVKNRKWRRVPASQRKRSRKLLTIQSPRLRTRKALQNLAADVRAKPKLISL